MLLSVREWGLQKLWSEIPAFTTKLLCGSLLQSKVMLGTLTFLGSPSQQSCFSVLLQPIEDGLSNHLVSVSQFFVVQEHQAGFQG